jgi:hypothetical protein
MPQRTRKGDSHDLHILMGVSHESLARGDLVVVEHTQGSEIHAIRAEIVRKTESVMALEPAVVGIAPGFAAMNSCGHMDLLFFFPLSSKSKIKKISKNFLC